jgi:Xaa-Pro aminopeptidase
VKWLSEFESVFHRLMCEVETVYLNSNEHPRASVVVETRDARFVAECQRRYPLHRYERLGRLMYKLRGVKTKREIELIRKAVEITAKGFRRVAQMVKPASRSTTSKLNSRTSSCATAATSPTTRSSRAVRTRACCITCRTTRY